MPRNSFCRQSKLASVGGRIDYITNPDRQEHLYATYTTAEPEFWKDLAEVNQQEYKKYGCKGKTVEGREWIIALEESLVTEDPDRILQSFTDAFHDKYKVDCIAALHHNHTLSNYHIHLIFSERQRLPEPVDKIATRNMFFDEEGHHRRTKKEILTTDGEIRKGCRIVPKGEVYESTFFTGKNPEFKTKKFGHDVKVLFTDLNNHFIADDTRKLSLFRQGSVYLATKKIGKNNPKEALIKIDNKARKEWNLKADEALVCGVMEEDILRVKKEQISKPVNESILSMGKQPGLLEEFILNAIQRLSEVIRTKKKQKKPVLTVDLKEFEEVKQVKKQLDDNQKKINLLEKKVSKLEQEYQTLYAPWKKKQNLKDRADLTNDITELQKQHWKIISKKGYRSVQSFMNAYHKSVAAIKQYQNVMIEFQELHGKEEPGAEVKQSIHDKLNQYKEQAKITKKQEQKTTIKSGIQI